MIVAASDAVMAAQVAAAGAVAVAVVGAIGTAFVARATGRTRDAIGRPNGRGNVVEMSEQVLDRIAELALAMHRHMEAEAEAREHDIARMDVMRAEQTAAHARTAGRLDHIEARIDHLEGELDRQKGDAK